MTPPPHEILAVPSLMNNNNDDTLRDILCIGVNPAFQTTLHFESFEKGRVNRAFKKTHSIGGKGQNVAIAIEQLGLPHKVSVLQFTGGSTGQYINDALADKQISHLSIPVNNPTRTCTTVLDYQSNSTTEVIEPSGSISAKELDAFQIIAKRILTSNHPIRGMALCGTFPIGVDGQLYEFLVSHKPTHCTLILDAYRGIESTLASGKIDILKINSDEARLLMNAPSTTSILELGRDVLTKYPIKNVAITQNAFCAYLFCSKSITNSAVQIHEYKLPSLHKLLVDHALVMDTNGRCTNLGSGNFIQRRNVRLPRMDLAMSNGNSPLAPRPRSASPDLFHCALLNSTLCSAGSLTPGIPDSTLDFTQGGIGTKSQLDERAQLVLNPLGAGDTCSGVTLAKFLESTDLVDAFKWGLSAASASCLMTETTAHFEVDVMNLVYQNIQVDQVA